MNLALQGCASGGDTTGRCRDHAAAIGVEREQVCGRIWSGKIIGMNHQTAEAVSNCASLDFGYRIGGGTANEEGGGADSKDEGELTSGCLEHGFELATIIVAYQTETPPVLQV